ncbi:MAG: hypothetical protein COW13_01700 [Candidatus Omnitrophica bacterium CG12_big_fil_rev_8_21_14_0_65_50_5]|nr:MAG: hypothetical protein COW13_01700 [Candidatus Omnitrophica bacterium CG12_big_fil_rev_8_21_14_0_65_50_5]
MKENTLILFFLIFVFSASGCGTTEKRKDVEKSIGVVAEVVTGRPMSEDDVKKIEQQMRRDPQARRAIKSIAGSGTPSVTKYCPIDGQRYAGNVEMCPVHNVKLEVVQP